MKTGSFGDSDSIINFTPQESNKKGNGKEIAVLGIAEAMLFHESRVHEISSLLRRRFIDNAGWKNSGEIRQEEGRRAEANLPSHLF
jgi:hypothetical protein